MGSPDLGVIRFATTHLVYTFRIFERDDRVQGLDHCVDALHSLVIYVIQSKESIGMKTRVQSRHLMGAVVALIAIVAMACAGETVIQTVVVEKEVQVAGETVIQTVVVEKEVQIAGETVIQTVVVEKEVQIAGETVVQTVVVEKEVQVAGETVVQTVVVEKEVQVAGETVVQTVVVEKEVEVGWRWLKKSK